MREATKECYDCKWSTRLEHSFFRCTKPSTKVKGFIALIKLGLFFYPIQYKPEAKRTKCPNFERK